MNVLLPLNLKIEFNAYMVRDNGPETQDEWLSRMATKYEISKVEVWNIVGQWFESRTA